MAHTLVDLVKIYATSTGSGAIGLGSAVAGYRGVEALINGAVYSYSIQQGSAYEVGAGTYLAAEAKMVRSPLYSSNGNAAIGLSANAEVAFVALASDFQTQGPNGDPGPPGSPGPQGKPGYRSFQTWAELNAVTGASAQETAYVYGPDTGTHTDPVVGGTVNNVGIYAWSVSPAGWGRVASMPFAAPTYYPEMFGATAYTTPDLAAAGTDSTAALDALYAAWYANGGGTIYLSGWYSDTKARLIQNTNTATTIGQQPPLRFDGIGGISIQNGRPSVGGAGIIWTAETGSAVAKIDTRGLGILVPDNCAFASVAGLSKPFIHTTFTAIMPGKGFGLVGGTIATNTSDAGEDGIILGGTVDYEGTGFDRRSADCGFQGYGTVIDSVAFVRGIRRAVVVQTYGNAIRITNNAIWNGCGYANGNGAAIEVDGSVGSTSGFATGVYISGNLVEVTNYKRAIYARQAAYGTIIGNDCYDAAGLTTEGVYIDSTCQLMSVHCSLNPATKPYVTNAANDTIILNNQQADGGDTMRRLTINNEQSYPNRFGCTIFDTTTTVQFSGSSTGGIAYQVLRAPLAASSPNVVAWAVRDTGAVEFSDPNSAVSGNVTVTAVGQAEYWNQGRWYGFNGRSGQEMGYNTGTGGSWFTARGYGMRWYDHTGAVIGSIVNGSFKMGGNQVLTTQQPAIANGSDSTVNAILAALRAHGLIAS